MTADPRALVALPADTFDVEERTPVHDFADRLYRYAAASGMTIQPGRAGRRDLPRGDAAMTPEGAQLSVGPATAEPRVAGGIDAELRAFVRRGDWHIETLSEHAEAVAFIESIHYAKGAPNTSVARHGLYDKAGVLCGVALWLPPTKNAALSVSGDHRGVLSLSRLCVAENVPTNGASFLLGRSMRAIPFGRWHTYLTYADTAEGHTGAIYKATNWTCLGLVKGSDNWIGPDGERRGRKRGPRNLTVREMEELGFTKLPRKPKWKFVYYRAAVAQEVSA